MSNNPVHKMKFESPCKSWSGEIGIMSEHDSINDDAYDNLIPHGSEVSLHELTPNEQIAIMQNAVKARGMW